MGLIIDERASDEEEAAITTIASGKAGGPPAILTMVIGNFLGVESRPIQVQKNGLRRSVSFRNCWNRVAKALPVPRIRPNRCTSTIRCTPPTPDSLSPKRSPSHLHAFGLDWDDTSQNNGHFAPFNWRSA